nr:MAG TPA: hypothetical protein [Caudoviricetes sp.]
MDLQTQVNGESLVTLQIKNRRVSFDLESSSKNEKLKFLGSASKSEQGLSVNVTIIDVESTAPLGSASFNSESGNNLSVNLNDSASDLFTVQEQFVIFIKELMSKSDELK